jgi:hypothetical protein
VRRYGGAYWQRYPASPGVAATLRALAACRTAALGGHVSRCTHCGDVTYHYHSCGNRHCPQCGGSKRAAWLARRRADLLDVPYVHVVFTLPHTLSALVLGNRKLLYGLLFDAAAQTLLEVAADAKHLGARIGVLAVLHTWGQQLEHHPHVHGVVPGGGLSADGRRWVCCRPNFFLPVKVLGRVFRGKYLAGLRQAYQRGALGLAGRTSELADAAAFAALLRSLYATEWVVYAKEPFGGPEPVLKYLTTYTHRVALSNRRLVKLAEDRVTFTWKDYADGCQTKKLTLGAVEFVRRFALHILPPGFVRLRQYGLLANRDRQQRLAQCRALLGSSASPWPGPGEATVASATSTEAQVSPPPGVSGRWLCLLVVLVGVLAAAERLPPSAVGRLVAALVTGPVVEERRCPVCGVGMRETIWQAARPTGAELQRRWQWDTS